MNDSVCHHLDGSTIYNLYQWDSGVQALIRGSNLGSVTEVHFSNVASSKALVVTPVRQGSDLLVDIPDVMLRSPMTIDVHVCGDTSNSDLRTLGATRIVVLPRVKPPHYSYT